MSKVISVNRSASHNFSKTPVGEIRLIAGEGVEGDAHRGSTVQHLSRVRRNPSKPNLRQVHLVHIELLEWLQSEGFRVKPASIGENITTAGIDLLALPADTRLRIGADAVLRVTGLRNPCKQLDDFQPGLMSMLLDRDDEGNLVRKSGVMAVVETGGIVRPGNAIEAIFPDATYSPLQPV